MKTLALIAHDNRVCNVHNVPLATNVATADLIIAGLVVGDTTPIPPA